MNRLWGLAYNALALFGAASLLALTWFEISRRLWPEGL